MSARQRLNAIFLGGVLLIAAVAGAIFGSWLVFLVAAGCMTGLAVHAGHIRPNRQPRSTRIRRRR